MKKRIMIVVLATAMSILPACISQKTAWQSVEVPENVENTNAQVPDTKHNELEKSDMRIYRIDKAFDQGGVITTVGSIALYEDNEDDKYNVIEFDINVTNNSGKDVYMLYYISPIILSTGEQKDETDKCDIYKIFRGVIKDGKLVYRVKSSLSDIKTIRWVMASPLHNGSEILGNDCDYTFILN